MAKTAQNISGGGRNSRITPSYNCSSLIKNRYSESRGPGLTFGPSWEHFGVKLTVWRAKNAGCVEKMDEIYCLWASLILKRIPAAWLGLVSPCKTYMRSNYRAIASVWCWLEINSWKTQRVISKIAKLVGNYNFKKLQGVLLKNWQLLGSQTT